MSSTILTEEELQAKLADKQEEQQLLFAEIDTIFEESSFLKAEKLNHVSYGFKTEQCNAMFSVDTTTLDYSCYISTSGNNSTEFSSKGNVEGLIKAAEHFVDTVQRVSNIATETAADDIL